MSALSAIEAPVPGGPGVADTPATDYGDRRRGLRVARHQLRPVPAAHGGLPGAEREPSCSSMTADARLRSAKAVPVRGTVLAQPRPGGRGTAQGQQRAGVSRTVIAPSSPGVSRTLIGPPPAGVSRAPLRLTRRGRAVVAALLVAGLTIAALLVSLAVPGGAQATDHSRAGAGYQGMHRIVVQPGQTLWSIASRAEPEANTRVVVQEIMTANLLNSTNIAAGQLLWVPR